MNVAEPHHFYASPAPDKNFDAAPLPAPVPAPVLTLPLLLVFHDYNCCQYE
jgi:hypothetical protein